MNLVERNAEHLRRIVRDESGATCPHLGLEDDPNTSALYARTDHRCLVPGSKIKAPDREWQERYCLSGRHDQCPIYRSNALGPVPQPARRSGRGRAVLIACGVILALTLFVAGAYALQGGRSNGGADAVKSHEPLGVVVGNATPTVLNYKTPTAVPTPSVATALAATNADPTPTIPVLVATPTEDTSTPMFVPTPTPAIPTAVPTATSTPAPTLTPTPAPTPTPEVVPTPSPAPGIARTHTVAPGETLSSIAAEYGVTVQQIVDLNHIQNPDQVNYGTVLQIPPP